METKKLLKQALWEETLEEACKCYADEVGNRACDYGATCDSCQATWVREVFLNKCKNAGIED